MYIHVYTYQHMFLEPINDLNTHFWSPGAGPKRSQVPQSGAKGSQSPPKRPQGTQRPFCNKNKKIT